MSFPDRGWHERLNHHVPPICEQCHSPIFPPGSFYRRVVRQKDGFVHYHRDCMRRNDDAA